MNSATEDTTARKMRQLEEDNLALRDDLRRLRADLDMMRSGRLGTLGFKTAALVGDNALNTAKYKDGSVTSAKIAGLDPAKLADGELPGAYELSGTVDVTGSIGSDGERPYRWNSQGLQILADDATPKRAVILFVPTYVDDVPITGGIVLPDVDFWAGIDANADDTDNYIRLIARNYTGNLASWFARFQAYADSSTANAELRAQRNAGTTAAMVLTAYATGLGTLELNDAMLLLDSETSDPTLNLNDGSLLYRSDTDKFRARVNGAWVNLIDSGDASWVDLTDGGATALHSHAGGGVASDTIWDAKGDLAVGTGADTAAKRTVGANNTILMADSGTSVGMDWVAATAPTTQALGDVAAAGAAGSAYNGPNHVHGMPAAATQAEMEAASSLLVVVTPGRVHFHPGVAKVWVQGTPNSTTIISSYNVTSLGDTATGQQTVTIATDFSSTAYNVQVTIGDTSTLLAQSGTVMSKAAGSYVMNSVIEAGSGDDPSTDWNSVGFGDQ